MLKRIIVFSLSALILVISCALPSLATGNHDTSDVDYYWGGYYEFEDGQFFQQYGITNYNSYNYEVALKSPNMVKEYATLTYEGSNMVGDYLDIYYQLNENYVHISGSSAPSTLIGTWDIKTSGFTAADFTEYIVFPNYGSPDPYISITCVDTQNRVITFNIQTLSFNDNASGRVRFIGGNSLGSATLTFNYSQNIVRLEYHYSTSLTRTVTCNSVVITINHLPDIVISEDVYDWFVANSNFGTIVDPYYPTPGYAQFYAVTESFSLPSEVLNDHLSQYYIYCDMSCVQAYIPGLQGTVDINCDVRIQGYDSTSHTFADISQLTYTSNDAASGSVSYTDSDAQIAVNWTANNARDYICVANLTGQVYDKYRVAWFCWAYLNVPWDDTGVTGLDPARSYNEKYYGRVRLEYVDPYVQVYKKKDVENAIANGTNIMIDQNNIIINQIGSPDPAIQNMFDAKIAENTVKIDSATSKQNAVFSQATNVVSQITAVNPAQMVSASFGDAYDSALGLWTGLSNVIFESDFVVFALSFVVTLATIYFIISAKVK